MSIERLIQDFRNEWLKQDRKLVEHINEIIKQQNLTGQVSLIEQQKQILSHIYQKAISYTNLIVLAGYAGIFGIWQHTREILSKQTTIWVALLTSCSIIIFVGYEVWKMIAEAIFIRRINKVIEENIALQERLAVWQQVFTEYARKQSKIWVFFLVPTLLFGFSAAFILIFQFIKNLYN